MKANGYVVTSGLASSSGEEKNQANERKKGVQNNNNNNNNNSNNNSNKSINQSMSENEKRVVFVSLSSSNNKQVQGPRTRRKRAIGVNHSISYEEFIKQVCQRLQIKGVRCIRHGASGILVQKIEDLMDIEDLVVEEISDDDDVVDGDGLNVKSTTTNGVNKRMNSQEKTSTSNANEMNSNKDVDEDAEKYKRRSTIATRQMQKVLPYSFAKKLNPAGESLDESFEDEEALLLKSGKKRTKKMGKMWWSDPRAIVVAVSLISCLLTMVLLYQRVSMLENEIDLQRNSGVMKTEGLHTNNKKESWRRKTIDRIEAAAIEAEKADPEMFVPEA